MTSFLKAATSALFSFTTTTCLPPETWQGGEVQHQTTYRLQGWIPQVHSAETQAPAKLPQLQTVPMPHGHTVKNK